MKSHRFQFSTSARALFGVLALAVLFAFGAPQAAQASTSAGATIFNKVTVDYSSGDFTGTATADASVTVATLAAKPTVTVDTTAQTTTAGSTVSYVYTVRSNSNGPDTYTLTTPVTSTNTGVTAPTNTPSAASVALWGGIVVGSGTGTISLPGGSTSGLAVNDTVELTVNGATNRYTVSGISAGNGASASTTETLATVTLTPVSGATAITATNVAAGTQVGQYSSLNLQQKAGTPSVAGTDGTHVTDLTFTTTATDGSGAVVTYTTSSTDTNEVTTTVSSPKLAITKTADKASAKPGEVITYTITVNNTSTTSDASNVTVTDPVPTYTAYVSGSTRLNGITVAGDGATSPLAGGLTVDSDSGRSAGVAATGTIPAGQTATITYQVTVQ